MNTNFSCGKRIKELRIERGLSQERVALNAGITPAYLGLVERGQRNATVNLRCNVCESGRVFLWECRRIPDRYFGQTDFGPAERLKQGRKAALFATAERCSSASQS